MGYYPVVGMLGGERRHISNLPGNTCGVINGRSAWQFNMPWGTHTTLQSALDGNGTNYSVSCKACRRNVEKAIRNGAI